MAIRISDLDPSDGSASTLAAAVFIERRDIARALKYSRRAFDAGSDINPAALLNDYKGQTPETRDATRNLLEALESDYPDDARSLFAIALLEWREGNGAVAVTKLDKLFTIDPFHDRGTLLLTKSSYKPMMRVLSIRYEKQSKRQIVACCAMNMHATCWVRRNWQRPKSNSMSWWRAQR